MSQKCNKKVFSKYTDVFVEEIKQFFSEVSTTCDVFFSRTKQNCEKKKRKKTVFFITRTSHKRHFVFFFEKQCLSYTRLKKKKVKNVFVSPKVAPTSAG